MTLFRRFRGVLASAALWAGAWALLSVPYTTWLMWAAGQPRDLWPGNFAYQALHWGLSGAGAGAAFALLLLLSERRQTIRSLSLFRVAAWGALGAVVLPLGIGIALQSFAALSGQFLGYSFASLGLGAALGAGSSLAAVRMARRADRVGLPSGNAQPYLPPAT